MENSKGIKFEIGDVVQLNSGGPYMTISNFSVNKEQPVFCKWFSSKGKLYTMTFDIEYLKKHINLLK